MAIFEQISVIDSSGNIINPVQDESIVLLRRACKMLAAVANTDISKRQVVILDAFINSSQQEFGSIGTTCIGVNGNDGNSSGSLAPQVGSYFHQPTWECPVDARWIHIDAARNTYAKAIRRKLVWS